MVLLKSKMYAIVDLLLIVDTTFVYIINVNTV